MLLGLRRTAGELLMWDWCRNWTGWDRIPWIQRRKFIAPLEQNWRRVSFPRSLRLRLWLGAKLKRATVWVLGELVPDPFDEEGPQLDHLVATVEDDGNEDS